MKKGSLIPKQAIPLMVAFVVLLGISWYLRSNFDQAELPEDLAIIQGVPNVPDISSLGSEFARALTRAYQGLLDDGQRKVSLEAIALLYHANGFPSEARMAYSGLIEVEPQNPQWSYLCALTFSDSTMPEEAIGLLVSVVASEPSYDPAWDRLLALNLRLGRIEAAQEVSESQAALSGRSASSIVNLGKVAFARGDYAESIELADEAIAEDQGSDGGYLLKIRSNEELGLYDRSAQIESSMDRNDIVERGHIDVWEEILIPYTHSESRILALMENRLDSAESGSIEIYFEALMEKAPGNLSLKRAYGGWLSELAASQIQANEIEAALDSLKRCLEVSPENLKAKRLLDALRLESD